MSASIVSTLSLGSTVLSAMHQTQSEISKLTIESTTGQYADLGLQLGDQSGYELSLRDQTNLLQALSTANNATVTNLSLSQTSINSMTSTAQSAVQTLTSLSAGSNTAAATLQNTGTNALQELIEDANTTSNGQYLFGGINSGVEPLTNYFSSTSGQTAFDTAFQNYFGFSTTSSNVSGITSAQMQDFLTGSSANSFSTLVSGSWTSWSSASSTNVTTEISPGETATTSTNANDAGFQQLAEGYAMLSQLGGLSLSASAQQTVISTASSLVDQGISSMDNTEATLGATQTQVTDASTSMSNQLTILQTQIGNLDNVDPESVATQLSSLQTQLETAYDLTSQLQKMNLAQYLPVS
jgi:flagellar hook-associated protein 3 FlgL